MTMLRIPTTRMMTKKTVPKVEMLAFSPVFWIFSLCILMSLESITFHTHDDFIYI